MIEYSILTPIVLGFLTHNDSYDREITSQDGHIAFDGSDILFIDNNNNSHTSHTVNHAIDIWLKQNKIRIKE